MQYIVRLLDETQLMEMKNTFEDSIFSQLDDYNVKSIIIYLQLNGIDFIEDIIVQYLDLFLIEHKQFIEKFELLKRKYPSNFVETLAFHFNLLDELY